MPITHLKLNGITQPLGFAPGPLLLSWLVEGSAAQGQREAGICVRSCSDPETAVWSCTGDLDWCGTPLQFTPAPRTRYQIEVSVTDSQGARHTGTTWFETGKLDEPWQGTWISPHRQPARSPVLSCRFSAGAPVVCARLYAVGLGLYQARLNGQPVSEEVLAPGVWDFEEETQYQTYDVTDLIQAENDLEVTLGNGWYKGRYGLDRPHPFGTRFALLAELHLLFADGTRRVICSDGSWTWRESDIGANGIYDGEELDRLWAESSDNPERPVEVIPAPLRVTDRLSLPVREMESLPVARILHTPAGETVLDFGQNHTGWIRFHSRLPRGARVTFEFGETLQNGNFYNGNYRTATGGFRYRSDGREETVCPTFTFFGFRYVRVSGWPEELPLEPGDFDSPVLYSELERTGWLTTGHPLVNRLYENVLWSQKSNFLSIPTDCPQRDERLGWTGDAQVFAPAACYNMDCRAFYRAYLHFVRAEQRRHGGAVPTYVPSMNDFTSCAIWGDAATLIPAALLRWSGVAEEIGEHYPMMQDWVDHVAAQNPGRLSETGFQLGDWLAQDGITPQSFKGGTDDVFLASAYWMNSAQITADLAGRLGLSRQSDRNSRLAAEIRQAILDRYFTPDGRLSVDTQAGYVTALHFGLWRRKDLLLAQFRRRLRFDNFQIRCGFAGAPLLCRVLAEHGMPELAAQLLLNRDFPGWLYCVELGATTIWERWNSLLPDGTISGTGMNSLNHYAYGSVMEYVYAHLAGLRPGSHGFRDAVLAPEPNLRLGHLDCTCLTPAGRYRCAWAIGTDGQLSVHLEIPFGCTASVTLPGSGRAPFPLTAGVYDYRYRPEADYRAVYHMDTRLSQLSGDPEAEELLRSALPQLFGILKEGNREFTTQTFRELSQAFYLGLNPENVSAAVQTLSGLLRAPGWDPEA